MDSQEIPNQLDQSNNCHKLVAIDRQETLEVLRADLMAEYQAWAAKVEWKEWKE